MFTGTFGHIAGFNNHFCPRTLRPTIAWGGLLQARDRVRRPGPHVAVHALAVDHSPQFPLTGSENKELPMTGSVNKVLPFTGYVNKELPCTSSVKKVLSFTGSVNKELSFYGSVNKELQFTGCSTMSCHLPVL